jgi:hypothetical protein
MPPTGKRCLYHANCPAPGDSDSLTRLYPRPTIKSRMKQSNNIQAARSARAELRSAAEPPSAAFFCGIQKGLRRLLAPAPALAAIVLLLGVTPLRAQDDHKRKVPVLDKIASTNGQEAFSGSIQSLDLKTSLLQVHSTRDKTDEYFPIKKNVHVATADGQRVTLDRLKPGISVLVYYEQKGDHRAVKEIVVLGGPGQTPKEKSTPPS